MMGTVGILNFISIIKSKIFNKKLKTQDLVIWSSVLIISRNRYIMMLIYYSKKQVLDSNRYSKNSLNMVKNIDGLLALD